MNLKTNKQQKKKYRLFRVIFRRVCVFVVLLIQKRFGLSFGGQQDFVRQQRSLQTLLHDVQARASSIGRRLADVGWQRKANQK